MPDQNNTAAAGCTDDSAGKLTESTAPEAAKQNKPQGSVISHTKKTPENMNDYIRVTNPGVWILIVAMLSMIIGALCWGVFGHVDRTLDATVYVKNGQTVCYVSETYASELEEGMTVRYSNTEGAISKINPADDGTNTCVVKAKRTLEDGYYNGTIVLEKISPVSFLLD